MISAIVITKNQESVIEACIKHLLWADEVVVVDNDSSDDTEKTAKKAGARLVVEAAKSFARVRNAGAKSAKGEWLLYVDTDEEIPHALQKEIQTISLRPPGVDDPVAYVIQRQNYYLGKPWPYHDGMIRFVYKPALIEWFGTLHETAKIDGRVGILTNRMIHRTHRTLEEMLEKTNQWSDVEAELRFNNNHPAIVPWRLFRVFATGFFHSYIQQGGWKVGTAGLIESMYQGFSMFITYAKLWEKQHKI